MLVGNFELGFHFSADALVLAHGLEELAHEFITLVLEKLVSAARGN